MNRLKSSLQFPVIQLGFELSSPVDQQQLLGQGRPGKARKLGERWWSLYEVRTRCLRNMGLENVGTEKDAQVSAFGAHRWCQHTSQSGSDTTDSVSVEFPQWICCQCFQHTVGSGSGTHAPSIERQWHL